MKNKFVIFFIFFIFFIYADDNLESYLYSDDDNEVESIQVNKENDYKENDYKENSTKKKTYQDKYLKKNDETKCLENYLPFVCPNNCGYNTPYDNKNYRCWNAIADASFLYLNAFEENLNLYTITLINNVVTGATELQKAIHSTSTFDFGYTPAFKIGMGYDFCYDNWQLYLDYTRFHKTFKNTLTPPISDGGTTINLKPSYVLSQILYPEIYILGPSILKSSLRLNLDLIDLELSRKYFVGKNLLFKTLFGIRNAFINQKLDQNFNIIAGRLDDGLFPNNSTFGKASNKISSWGIGPKMGFNTNWNIYKGFSFVGNADTSVLYTKYKLQGYENSTINYYTVGRVLTVRSVNQKYESVKISPLKVNLDIKIGLENKKYIKCWKSYLGTLIAYDFSAFFNQNLFLVQRSHAAITFANNQDDYGALTIENGNLYLHGLNIQLKLEF